MKNTRTGLLLALVFIANTVFAQFNYQPVKPKVTHLTEALGKLKDPNNKSVLVVAHRGDWRNSPENSIMAIENAIAMGVDMVEIDLQKTKDGQLVLMHDATIDRTTNGKGKVSDWTLDSLKTLFLEDGLHVITLQKIPTLEEAMLVIKGKIMVNLDKGYDYFAQSYDILKKTGTLSQALMKSEYPAEKVIAENGRFFKDVMYMPVVNLDKPDALSIIKEYQAKVKPVAFELIFSRDTSSVIKIVSQLKKEGTRFWVNSLWDRLCGGHGDERAILDPEANYGWMLNQGFTLIQTDRPAFLIDYLRGKKLHN